MGLFAKTMNIKHLLRLFKIPLNRIDPLEQVLDVKEQLWRPLQISRPFWTILNEWLYGNISTAPKLLST